MMAEIPWYKKAVFYQLHVRCFHDSNGDGIGDFKGLSKKLDYIQNLGCTALWLQPFYPSPLLDDGYDISDYYTIHPDYGSLKDFKFFLKEAHKRGLKVITELVINHTSDQHIWFQRARSSPAGSKWRNYYVWSDTPDKYRDARIIFKDFETSNWAWDPVAKAYYWHRFYSHQPDLNYDNLEVHKEIFKILDFWMGMGVDGMRLDAVPYLYAKEGTDCENLPETHFFLKKLRSHIDTKFNDRMLLAEANQWPDSASAYFGDGNECHMAFHFPVMPRLFMSLNMEDRFPIIDIMEQTPIPPQNCQWAMFLRNHDELTLEMVTDEERDYMYRVYAKEPKARINLGIRRRLAPLLDNDIDKIKLMNILLLSLPGSPVIYYGDEIGMGDNYYLGDRNGVRTPMQWNTDRNAGFSNASPQKLYLPLVIEPEYHHSYINVENQEKSLNSLLWWTRHILRVRDRYSAFGLGSLRFIHPSNAKILAFIREYEDQNIFVIVNLSRYSQYVELTLPEFVGYDVRDLFSQNRFAPVRDPNSYGITIAGHSFYWLKFDKSKEPIATDANELKEIIIDRSWQDLLIAKIQTTKRLRECIKNYLRTCRFYRSKTKSIEDIQFLEIVPIGQSVVVYLSVITEDNESEIYLLPITFLPVENSESFLKEFATAPIAKVQTEEGKGFLIDATYDQEFQTKLVESLIQRKKIKGSHGKIISIKSKFFNKFFKNFDITPSRIMSKEQSNSSILYKDSFILKLYRKIEEGINPDIELVRYLSEDKKLSFIPKYAGSLEWKDSNQAPMALGLMQAFVPSGGDMWDYTLDNIRLFLENIVSEKQINKEVEWPEFDIYKLSAIPQNVGDYIGWMYLETIEKIGCVTAKMHAAFSQAKGQDLTPEVVTPFYLKSLFQAMRGQLRRNIELAKESRKKLSDDNKKLVDTFISLEQAILKKFQKICDVKTNMFKIRIHGDYHLGQVLNTGSEPTIIDFEGEPLLPLSERRLKRVAMQDVAGMIRSFQYAAENMLIKEKKLASGKDIDVTRFLDVWYQVVAATFLKAYLENLKEATKKVVPATQENFKIFLDAFLLHKAVYEIGYELNNRPDWVFIPLKGIAKIIGE